jgi:hypothetical protein
MSALALEYVLFVFVASCGMVQLVSYRSKLRGLLFFRNRMLTYIFAVLAIGGSFAWFFGWGDRFRDRIMHQGLEGSQQFGYFILGAAVAVVFTVLVSAVINRGECVVSGNDTEKGLDLLRGCSYLRALKRSLGMEKDKGEQ